MQLKAWIFSVYFVGWSASAQLMIPTAFGASFVQKVTTPTHKTIRYSGTLNINKTRAFRWKYVHPKAKEICGDGAEVRIVDHDLEQVIVYRVGGLLDLMQLLKRAQRYRDQLYTAKYHGVTYTLKLNQQGRIEQIAYKDDLDNVVHIRFRNIQYLDRSFGQEDLVCPVPKGYDIVREKL